MYTLAISGEATDPCGVPLLLSDHWPSSDTPAFSHFRDQAKYPSIGHPVARCELFKAHS